MGKSLLYRQQHNVNRQDDYELQVPSGIFGIGGAVIIVPFLMPVFYMNQLSAVGI
jgi:hypothetical protein